MLKEASGEEIEKLVWFTEKLCAMKEPVGLRFKAYACYGGNKAYACDWCASRDALLCLMERNDAKGYIANTLGYIYYYGRCTDGVPDYEKAYYYFTIGAAGGVYESRYKLSDMFVHGYYVHKNHEIAAHMLFDLYNENVKYIRDNYVDTKFADIALRVGNLYRFGIGVPKDYNRAYYYYLQADFAIKERMKEGDFYGDARVAQNIREAIEHVLPQTDYREPKSVLELYCGELSSMVNDACDRQKMAVTITYLENHQYRLQFSRVRNERFHPYPQRFFITLPEAHFCGFLNTIQVETKDVNHVEIYDFDGKQTTLLIDEMGGFVMYDYGSQLAFLEAYDYEMNVETMLHPKVYRVASVVFPNSTRHYDYLCGDLELSAHDEVIVMTREGEKQVKVAYVCDKTELQLKLPISAYKTILRKA